MEAKPRRASIDKVLNDIGNSERSLEERSVERSKKGKSALKPENGRMFSEKRIAESKNTMKSLKSAKSIQFKMTEEVFEYAKRTPQPN